MDFSWKLKRKEIWTSNRTFNTDWFPRHALWTKIRTFNHSWISKHEFWTEIRSFNHTFTLAITDPQIWTFNHTFIHTFAVILAKTNSVGMNHPKASARTPACVYLLVLRWFDATEFVFARITANVWMKLWLKVQIRGVCDCKCESVIESTDFSSKNRAGKFNCNWKYGF